MKHTTPLLLALIALSTPLSHASDPIPDAAQYTVMSNGVVIPSPETYYVPAADPSPTPDASASATPDASPAPSPFTGWDGTTYYINGEATSLDQNGYGWGNDGKFYSGGQLYSGYDSPTMIYFFAGQPGWGLNSDGTGPWNGAFYYNGQATTLDQSGNGTWNGVTYSSGAPSGYNGWGWRGMYVNGQPFTGFDYQTTGIYFIGGQPTWGLGTDGTGAYHMKYYVGGQETTLDQSGNGTWNDVTYVNGVAQ